MIVPVGEFIQRPYREEGEGVLIHEGPDRHGRWLYTETWMSNYHPGHPDGENRHALRAQVFRSSIPGWVKEIK